MKYPSYNNFPTTNKTIHVGDIWYAYFPFRELGNYEKLRPVLISSIEEDTIKAKMITSNNKKGKLIIIRNKVKSRLLYKNSYLTNNEAILTEDKIYSKIATKNDYEIKE